MAAEPTERPTRDAQRTRREILEVATSEFADRGYAGARVDEIASRTRTTKRMIYYYFGGKEQLYVAVLEQAYARIREVEQEIDLAGLDPVAAVREVAERTFDHHRSHPDFIRLVSIENIHRAEHLSASEHLTQLNTPAVDLLERILARGYADRVFHRQLDAVDLHMMISSFCVFGVANRHTFGAIFGRDLAHPALAARYRRMVGDMVVSYLTDAPEGAPR